MLPDLIRESDLWGPIFALVVFSSLLLIAAFVQVIFQIMLRRKKSTASNSLYLQLISTLRGPTVLFLVLMGMFLGFTTLTELTTPTFSILNGLDYWVRKVWMLVIIAEISYLVVNMTQVIMGWYITAIAKRSSPGMESKLIPPIRKILPVIVYSVSTLIALESLDISISPLLAGFGIGGLAVALAVQPTLSNFFAGTYLVTEGELKVGNYIELDGGPAGYVVDVGWRSTKIRSRYNNLVIIPNSKMADSIVTNYSSQTPAMNVVVTSGVSYDSDLEKVEAIVLKATNEIVSKSDDAIKDTPPFFGFDSFGDSNIDFWVFLQARDRLTSFALKSKLIKLIHQRFNEAGIEINYPVRKLIYPNEVNQANEDT